MHEFPDPYNLDEDFFSAGSDDSTCPEASMAQRAQDTTRVRPRAVLAGCADGRRQAIARLMDAHEARLPRPAMVSGTTAPLASEEEACPFTACAALPLQVHDAPWEPTREEDDFELWEELDRPSSRKSLRSMV